MGNTPFLQELESRALADRVPIIRRDMQSFMRMLLAVKQPKRILEVGTAVGFSTLLMCEYGPKDLKKEFLWQRIISGVQEGNPRLHFWKEMPVRS